MEIKKISKQLSDILPNRTTPPNLDNFQISDLIDQEAARIKAKQEAKELAKIKYAEKQKLKNLKSKEEKNQLLAKELGLSEIQSSKTEHQIKVIAEQQKKIEAIEAIEAQVVEPLKITELAKNNKKGSCSSIIGEAIKLQGASRPEIAKLLTALNINLSVQLTKQDTANLLACLLTCNEAQLAALYNNKKIPIVIKTVIRRLQEDAKLGNIETIEKLWDRVFGKGQMQLNLPEDQQLQTGIIPNVPISREAYIIIRDTLIK